MVTGTHRKVTEGQDEGVDDACHQLDFADHEQHLGKDWKHLHRMRHHVHLSVWTSAKNALVQGRLCSSLFTSANPESHGLATSLEIF